MLQLSRRRLILTGLIAAPAIIAIDRLMPVRAWASIPMIVTREQAKDIWLALHEDGTSATLIQTISSAHENYDTFRIERLENLSPRELWNLTQKYPSRPIRKPIDWTGVPLDSRRLEHVQPSR